MKTLLVSLCVSFMAASSFAETYSPRVEPLMGVLTTADGIYIQTFSGGCTTKNSFVAQKETHDNVTALTFLRVEADPCLALYLYGTILNYSYEELGLHANENFIVRNPLTFSRVR